MAILHLSKEISGCKPVSLCPKNQTIDAIEGNSEELKFDDKKPSLWQKFKTGVANFINGISAHIGLGKFIGKKG